MPLPSGQLTGLRKTQGVYSRVTTNILNMDFKILDSKCHVLANFSVAPNGKVPVPEIHMEKAETIVAHELWRPAGEFCTFERCPQPQATPTLE